jgi:hypothetical protein
LNAVKALPELLGSASGAALLFRDDMDLFEAVGVHVIELGLCELGI